MGIHIMLLIASLCISLWSLSAGSTTAPYIVAIWLATGAYFIFWWARK